MRCRLVIISIDSPNHHIRGHLRNKVSINDRPFFSKGIFGTRKWMGDSLIHPFFLCLDGGEIKRQIPCDVMFSFGLREKGFLQNIVTSNQTRENPSSIFLCQTCPKAKKKTKKTQKGLQYRVRIQWLVCILGYGQSMVGPMDEIFRSCVCVPLTQN